MSSFLLLAGQRPPVRLRFKTSGVWPGPASQPPGASWGDSAGASLAICRLWDSAASREGQGRF